MTGSPTPASPVADDAPLLVGRERERALLARQLAATLAGRGGLVLIGGEAGIGKTALAEDLAREATAQGALVLIGRCYDLSETPPYGPWAEAFEQAPATHDRSHLPTPLGSGEAAANQAALFARVREALTELAGQQSLVLLLDDLHWADQASFDLLRYLARRVTALPVLLLTTYRSDELTRRHPLFQLLPALVREARATRLDLRRLDDEAIQALLAGRYHLPAPDQARLAAYLREHADGNPFYAGELLRALEDEGLLSRAGGGQVVGDLARARVPPLLRQVIEARVARLGEDARAPLAVAAVIGQEVPLDLWSTVADADEDTLLGIVERAIEASVLTEAREGAAVRFAHALVREALYEGQVAVRRRRLHRRVGEALAASSHSDPDAVGYHFRQAGDARAAQWLVRAGERAQWGYAWLGAAERFQAALDLLEAGGASPRERGLLLIRLARTRRAAAPPEALAHLDEALALADAVDDRVLAAAALFQRGLLRCLALDFRRGLADLEVAIRSADALPAAEVEQLALETGDDGDEHHGRGTLAIQLATTGRYAEARRAAAPYLAESSGLPAHRVPGTSTYGDAYQGLGYALAGLGQPEEARRALAHAREAYRTVQHHGQVGAGALHELAWVMVPYQADRLAERERLAAEAEAALARGSGATPGVPTRLARLPLLVLEGQWAEAHAVAAGVREANHSRPGWRLLVALVLGTLARERGDPERAWGHVREIVPHGPAAEPGDTILLYALAAQRLAATLALDTGDLSTARAWLDAHDRWLAWSGAILGRSEGQFGWAAYHRAAGDLALARGHAERALAHAMEPRQPLALLAAHRLLGELDTAAGQHAEAGAYLAEALALAEACAAPYERALTVLALAERCLGMASGHGHDAAAQALLEEVRAICAPLDARPALARADALAGKRASPAASAPAYPAGLTAREVEVLRLVARGLSNPEVAAQLYLSPRTVGRHLDSIYTKLGVSSRTAASRVAIEHHLA